MFEALECVLIEPFYGIEIFTTMHGVWEGDWGRGIGGRDVKEEEE